MIVKTYSASITINCPNTAIFAIYEDVDSWPLWDPDIEGAGLTGDFAPGSTGWIKPVNSPRLTTLLEEVDRPQRWVASSKLPLVRMRFVHILETLDDNQTKVSHSLELSGLGAGIFALFAGQKISSGFPRVMQSLKVFAEQQMDA